jgi:hypothetical protein
MSESATSRAPRTAPFRGPRTAPFRVPGEGAMLVQLARRGVVRRSASAENVATTQRIRRIDDNPPLPRIKSPGYRPISQVTPNRGNQ